MYEIKILENACTALIALSDKYAEDTSSRSNIYHLLRFACTSIKEYPQKDVSLEKLSDRLTACSERLEKLAGESVSESITVLNCGVETKDIPLPIVNAHGSIVRLIRNAIEEKSVKDFLKLHQVAALYEISDFTTGGTLFNVTAGYMFASWTPGLRYRNIHRIIISSLTIVKTTRIVWLRIFTKNISNINK